MRLRYEQGQLKVAYGPKMRQASHTTCIENAFMGNMSYRGYLGITARNSDRNIKGIDVSISKVMNMDPAFYTT